MTTLKYALAYAARGLRVLPVRELGKEPLVQHGVHGASADETTIRSWWARWPAANIALAVPASFFVVDVDLRNGGDATLRVLQHAHDELPRTVTARTGSGGEHLLFARPAGVRLRGKLAPGVDLLGVGRYIVAPPSIHPCGGRYRWTSARGTQIAPPPTWLIELARQPEATPPVPQRPRTTFAPATMIRRARRYLSRCPPAISGSGGHLHTFVVAQRLVRGFQLDAATALSLLAVWNATCEPPWSERELTHKIAEASRVGRMVPGELANTKKSRAA